MTVLFISTILFVIVLCNIENVIAGNFFLKPFQGSRFGNSKLALTAHRIIKIRGGDNIPETIDLDLDDQLEEDDEEDGLESRTSIRDIPIVNKAKSIWNKTPPVTQLYVGSSIAITILSFILNQNKWPDLLHFEWSSILTGQVWRLISAFLYFGQLDLFYPLTMQFVWQHMAQLEKLSYNKPEDFVMMILFGGISLISLYSILGISTRFLGHNLATYLVYIWSRVFEGTDVNFMDLFTLKSELLPWFFSVQTLLLEREIPYADLIGIFVGHLYYYLKQKDILHAPERIRSYFQSERMKLKYSSFKNDFE